MLDENFTLSEIMTSFGHMSAQQVMDDLIDVVGIDVLLDYLHSKDLLRKSSVEESQCIIDATVNAAEILLLVEDFYRKHPNAC